MPAWHCLALSGDEQGKVCVSVCTLSQEVACSLKRDGKRKIWNFTEL